MNMEDKEIINNFARDRHLKKSTIYSYETAVKTYTRFNELTLHELLNEAEKEEEQGIRWKYRTLKTRLIEFRNFLNDKYLMNTATKIFGRILTLYRHYEIEIHDLPKVSSNNLNKGIPISFKDLPTNEIIKKALKIATPLMRVIILFISSSGCAKREVLNLKIKDFINATKEYHNENNIYDVLNVIKDRDDLVPMFEVKRQKTNKYYYTFCSPEATSEIVNYLLSRNKILNENEQLFKISHSNMSEKFIEINNALRLGKKGTYNRFRSHMLRKFHASQLYNDGVSMEIVDALQGRGKDSTHTSYFMEDPNKLKEIYIEHLNAVTINLDVENITFKSKEYNELEAKYENEKRTNEENTKRIDKLEQLFQNSNILDKI